MARPPRRSARRGCRWSPRAHFSQACGAWYHVRRRASHLGRSMSADDGEEGREERGGQEHRHCHDHEPTQPDTPRFDERREEQGRESDDDREAGRHHRHTRGEHRVHGGLLAAHAAAQLLAEARHDEERIVDPDAQADHRRHVEHEDGHRRMAGEHADDREGDRDGQEAHDERQRGRHQRAEGEHQDDERERQQPQLSGAAVFGAHRANVEIERGTPGHVRAVCRRIVKRAHRAVYRLPGRHHELSDGVSLRDRQRGQEKGRAMIGTDERRIIGGGPGNDAPDVVLLAQHADQAVEDHPGAARIERRRRLERDDEIIRERPVEALAQHPLREPGFGHPLTAATDVEELGSVVRARRCQGAHRDPHEENRPAPADEGACQQTHNDRTVSGFGMMRPRPRVAKC